MEESSVTRCHAKQNLGRLSFPTVSGSDNDTDAEDARHASADGYAVDALADALHAELKLGAEAATLPKKKLNMVLVLLDCNGMLVHRSKECVKGRKPDFYVPTGRFKSYPMYYYIRPHARDLVCCLLQDPRCEVAVYTSIMAKNVMPVILAFDQYFRKMTAEGKFESISCSASTSSTGYIEGYAYSLLDDTLGLYDQEYNSPDAQGANDWDTMRDLNKIWRARKVKTMGFGPENTLMVDAEARKVRNWKQNAIVVPEYTEAHLLLNSTEEPNTLRKLWEYLDETILSKMQRDEFAKKGGVQRIIREFPFPG